MAHTRQEADRIIAAVSDEMEKSVITYTTFLTCADPLGCASGSAALVLGSDEPSWVSKLAHPAADSNGKPTINPAVTANGSSYALKVSHLALRALLYEVCTTPKPGLVDRANSGSHKDMDIYTFVDSACALQPYFEECVRIGKETALLAAPETFRRLRLAGIQAEKEMYIATGGVNTHKGAIFSMGIICAAIGRLAETPSGENRLPGASRGGSRPAVHPAADAILSECAAMTRGLTASDFAGLTPDQAVTTGQRLYLQYGITGIRGQAEAGFPAVRETGLPVLKNGISMGLSINDAGCAALLALMCASTDTNMIARSSIDTQQRIVGEIRELLIADPYPDRQTLEDLDREFISLNLSPGGSADLLAICYLLYFLGVS